MQKENINQRIEQLADGDEDAARWLVDNYHQKLVQLARKKLSTMPPQVADDEGAVISAFRSFFSGVQAGQFPELEDRDNLWKLLATITTRKAIAQLRHHWRHCGEGGKIADWPHLDGLLCSEPTPDHAAAFLDECQQQINNLPDEWLRNIALLKLQGWNTTEIAEKYSVHCRTIQRKVALIQTHWMEATSS